MKRIFIIVSLLALAAVTAGAQTVAKDLPVIRYGHEDSSISRASANDLELSSLLNRESRLLGYRRAALIVSLSGSAVAGVGIALSNHNYETNRVAGHTFNMIGAVIATAGGIWLLVNEFQLIGVHRSINDHMRFRLGPTGVRVSF